MRHWKKLIFGTWSWTRPLKSLAFIYLALLAIVVCFADRFIHRPPSPGYSLESHPVITTTTPEGHSIAMIHFPAQKGKPTLLWSHGNAEDIGYLEPRLREFHSRGYGILAYDYPGYGLSEGTPGEQNCYDACASAWTYLTEKLNIDANQIIIYGQSVGSGPAVWMAQQKPCAGLILVTPFVSAFRAVTRIPLFPGDKFNNISRIDSISSPLLVIHGSNDRVIAPWHGRELFQHHPGPKEFLYIEGAGHNDLYLLATEDILDALDSFCNQHISPTAGAHKRTSKKSSITAR